MKNKNLYFVLILTLGISCKSWKNTLIKKGNKEDAISVVIKDYMINIKNNKKTFQIFNMNTYKSIYIFDIEPIDYILLQEKVGDYSNSFTTRFKEINNKLFIWRDSTVPVTQELLNIFNKFKLTDSLGFKLMGKNGFSLIDSIPEDDINNKKFERFYYICKDNLAQYKRTKRYHWAKKDIEKIEKELHCKQ